MSAPIPIPRCRRHPTYSLASCATCNPQPLAKVKR